MRLIVRPEERRPDPPPLDTDLKLPILVGVGVWTVLFVLALVFKGRLDERGLDWWVWTPLVGAVLGLTGLQLVRNRARRARRPAGPTPEPHPEPQPQPAPEPSGRATRQSSAGR